MGIIAYCGISCHTCPIFVATRTLNRATQAHMRAEIARVLSERYGMICGPDDVTDCDGCSIERGRLFALCRNCFIRGCARSREIGSCAHCIDYPCDQLEAFLESEPGARARLEAVRH